MLNLEMEELRTKYEKLLKVHGKLVEDTKAEREELFSIRVTLAEQEKSMKKYL